MTQKLVRKLFIFAIFSLFLTSCGLSYQSDVDYYSSVLEEETRCATSVVVTGGVSITGTATFQKRTLDVVTETTMVPPAVTPTTKLKNMALSDPLPTALPIQSAEIAIYNSNNERIQCGSTDNSGNIKAVDQVSTLKIPNVVGSYRLRVVSRSYKIYASNPANFIYISVKKDKYRNELHALTANFSLSGAGTNVPVNLIAKARQIDSEDIEAGAFNILNSLQTGFDYIKVNTPGVDTTCLSEKLNVFWKAGFNPMQYQDPESDPATLGNTSFYSSETKELFISGGQLGDMSLSNTDHFDDFAVIHESGHFIEDHCGQWTSPGGNHTIISRIDPRLAWSEGWANYFAAHVIHDRINDLDNTLMTKFAALTENAVTNTGWTYFFNSYGFSDTVQNIGNGDGFVIDLKRPGTDPGAYTFAPYTGQEFDRVSPSSFPGEGHTREGAVSRGLFKLTNSCGEKCAYNPTPFINIWQAFDKFTGTAFDNNPFQGVDKVLEKLKASVGTGPWNADSNPPPNPKLSLNDVVESEALHLRSNGTFGSPSSWPGYATNLVYSPSICTQKILPKSDDSSNGFSSDQRYSNHFYTIDFSLLSGLNRITVSFRKNIGNIGSSLDHDLILFKPGYFFNDDLVCNGYDSSGNCSGFSANRDNTNSDIYVMNREPASGLSSYSKTIFLNGIDRTQKYLLDIRAWTAKISVLSSSDYTYDITSDLGGGYLCPQP